MSENFCIYSPTQSTTEHVEQCSTTPPLPAAPLSRNSRIRNFIKSISESDIGNSNSERGDGASSPPNCAICLGKISSKCFTDSCMHQFCFSCLLEWSKIKAECPLCKQPFKSIIHNVNSKYEFSEHKVETFGAADWGNFINQYFLHSAVYPAIPPAAPRFSSNRTAAGSLFQQSHDTVLTRICQLLQSPVTPLIDRFAREHANEIIPHRSNGTEWRAYVYQRNLYALPLLDVNGRSRDITANFYRQNPAQVHRLMPWINRELIGLVNTGQLFSNGLLQRIEELIMVHGMTSVIFRRQITEYINRNTAHFIHELINYARSPFDMIGYDRNVQYRPYFEEDIESLDSSDSLDTVSTFSGSAFMSENNFLVNSNRDALSDRLNRLTARIQENLFPYIRPQPVIESVQIDSDDSDVVYVSQQKPPHLRTPEQVELNSDTDSDVQFVSENVTTTTATTKTASIENSIGVQTSQPSSPIIGTTNDNQISSVTPNISIQCGNGKLTHTQDISVDIDSDSWIDNNTNGNCSNNNKTKRQQRKWDRRSSNDSDGFSTIIKVDPNNSNKTNELPKTITNTETASASISSKDDIDVNSINYGASTSTTEINNRRSVITKNYARPKRRVSSTLRKKMRRTIYESSSSSASSDDSSDDSDSNSSSSTNGSTSSESSHEEYRASTRQPSSSRLNRRKPMTQQRKRRRKTPSKSTLAKKRQKLDVIRLKKDKTANYRLVVSNDSSDDDLGSTNAKQSDHENKKSSVSSEPSSSDDF